MGIDVTRTDEDGCVLENLPDPSNLLRSLATDTWSEDESSRFLQFIDPWGNTTFNQLQLPGLIAELELAAASAASLEHKAHLERVVAFVRAASGSVHEYIMFTGD